MGCWIAQPVFGAGIGGGARTRACGPCGEGVGKGIGVLETVQVLVTKGVVVTRWVLAWGEVGCGKAEKARLAAKSYRDPDPRDSNVDFAGCVSRMSSHLKLISLGASQEWKLWILDIKNPFLRADGSCSMRVDFQGRPPHSEIDAPAAFHRPSVKYLASSVLSLPKVGLRSEASSSDPFLCFP